MSVKIVLSILLFNIFSLASFKGLDVVNFKKELKKVTHSGNLLDKLRLLDLIERAEREDTLNSQKIKKLLTKAHEELNNQKRQIESNLFFSKKMRSAFNIINKFRPAIKHVAASSAGIVAASSLTKNADEFIGYLSKEYPEFNKRYVKFYEAVNGSSPQLIDGVYVPNSKNQEIRDLFIKRGVCFCCLAVGFMGVTVLAYNIIKKKQKQLKIINKNIETIQSLLKLV